MSIRLIASLGAVGAMLALLLLPGATASAQVFGRLHETLEMGFGYHRMALEETTIFNGRIVPGRRTEVTIDGLQFGLTFFLPVVELGGVVLGPHAGANAILVVGDEEEGWIDGLHSNGVFGFDFPIFIGARTGRGASLSRERGLGGGLGVGVRPAFFLFEDELHFTPAAMAELRFGLHRPSAVRLVYSLEHEHWSTLRSQTLSVDLLIGF